MTINYYTESLVLRNTCAYITYSVYICNIIFIDPLLDVMECVIYLIMQVVASLNNTGHVLVASSWIASV